MHGKLTSMQFVIFVALEVAHEILMPWIKLLTFYFKFYARVWWNITLLLPYS